MNYLTMSEKIKILKSFAPETESLKNQISHLIIFRNNEIIETDTDEFSAFELVLDVRDRLSLIEENLILIGSEFHDFDTLEKDFIYLLKELNNLKSCKCYAQISKELEPIENFSTRVKSALRNSPESLLGVYDEIDSLNETLAIVSQTMKMQIPLMINTPEITHDQMVWDTQELENLYHELMSLNGDIQSLKEALTDSAFSLLITHSVLNHILNDEIINKIQSICQILKEYLSKQ